MLLGEQGRRHQDRHLLAVIDCGEGGAQRHFRLAETDVAADDAVHRIPGREVREHLVDGARLVLGRLEREVLLEGPVVGLGPAEPVAGAGGPSRVDVEQLRGDVADPARGLLPGFRPLVAAQPVQRRVFGRRARVTRHQVQRADGHVQLVAVGILEAQEFARHAAGFQGDQALVASDAVLRVHDGGAGRQVVQLADDGLGIALGAPAP